MKSQRGWVEARSRISIFSQARAIGAPLLLVGTLTVVGQSAPLVSPSPNEMTPQMPDPKTTQSPTNSWNKPEFEGNPKNMGSPYVSLDSWIYPSLRPPHRARLRSFCNSRATALDSPGMFPFAG